MTLMPAPTVGDTSWFTHDRFGMFIHWGLYALAARHEWVKHHEDFCLWDTALTDYKAPNTPAGRDLLRPMVDGRSRGCDPQRIRRIRTNRGIDADPTHPLWINSPV